MRRTLLLCLLTSAFCLPLWAKNGAFRSTGHGNPDKGPQRLANKPRGSCAQCHDEHASHDRSRSRVPNPKALFAPDDNDLCFVCHTAPSESGVFPGSATWQRSGHATSPRMTKGADANRCVICHDPHGVRDANGVIPAMLAAREPDLCLQCHDGSRGPDIRSQLMKSYPHAIGARGRHAPGESDPAKFGSYPSNNRHATCSDCHNVHQATQDPASPSQPQASNRLAGVSRVEVVNGGAGVAPAFRWRAAGDPGEANEYEICFKCHSSWAKQPPGKADLALLTNPANASYHPIQAAGKNRNIPREAFANNMAADSVIACSDCHTSDDDRVRGPHGSMYPYLLKKPPATSTMAEGMTPNDLCFDCHTYGVYADPKSPKEVLQFSRFNSPAGEGHAFHVGAQHLPCYACHETHGSARLPALIARGRFPGISTYVQTQSGGTCASSCHGMKTYSVNYPR